ncbi:hypothetical protein CK203_109409 [Vitis vinifera]|uniref:Uncharacterized protein n=1 Tax=Vitis vinifera TaxID=29760 RepID=A0A438BQM9_VITVI|nr:hypothetical protein CK203_109409 [Vitis vinifera]
MKAQWFQDAPDGMYQYFIKVVPTIYTDIRGHHYSVKSGYFQRGTLVIPTLHDKYLCHSWR